MKGIRRTLLRIFMVFASLGTIDIAESFPFAQPTTIANQNTTPWTKQARRNQRKIIDVVFKSNGLPHMENLVPTNFPLGMSSSNRNEGISDDDSATTSSSRSLIRFAIFAGVGVLYWYLLVLGAAAKANGLFVPDFIPMVPGWPVSDADLAPVLEDSFHFFYLSDLLQNPDAPYVSPPRLAIFNLVEAWIFAMLPALWRDERRRLPRPVLLVSWLALGINLTNAFLAPYLAITELRGSSSTSGGSKDDEESGRVRKNPILAGLFAVIAIAVVGHAASESMSVAKAADWQNFAHLARTDRSYLAFCVDPVLFALFQPLLLARIKTKPDPTDYVPFVGLMLWLLFDEKQE